jgi:hypothetical protein
MAETKDLGARLGELDTEIAGISAFRKKLKLQMRELIAERDKILAAISAAHKLKEITPAEREALAELLGSEGEAAI